MIDLPRPATFAAILTEPRFYTAMAVSLIAGAVRGFSGFGSALIYIPLVAAVYEPRIAAVTLLLIDTVGSAPFAVRALRQCNWHEVLPISVAAAIAIPFGTMALVLIDPILLRWFITALVLSLLVVLMTGWRYRGPPRLPISIGVGLFAGFGGGAVQISGPAVIVYWLGRDNAAAMVRANLMVYFLLSDLILCAAYSWQGLFTADTIVLALLLGIPFFLTVAAGAFFFQRASERLYRRIAYVIIAAAALVSMPVLDGFLR